MARIGTDQKSEIETFKNKVEELEHKINVMSFETEKRLNYIEEFREKAKTNFFEIEKRFVEAEKHTEQPADVSRLQKKIDELEHILTAVELEIVKKGDHPIQASQKPQASQTVYSVPQTQQKITERVVEKMPQELELRLKTVEQSLSALSDKLNKEMCCMENALKEIPKKTVAAEDVEDIHQELRETLSKAELFQKELHNIEHNFATRQETDNIATMLEDHIEKIQTNLDRVTALEKSLDNYLISIEERITEHLEKMGHVFDSRIIETEEKLEQVLKNIPSKHQVVNEFELKTLQILTEKLEHFSEMLDRKFSQFMTRDEFEKHKMLLEGRIATIEVPNITPLIQRMGGLELRVHELSQLIEHLSDKMPLVVE